jgi:hypothetical protein
MNLNDAELRPVPANGCRACGSARPHAASCSLDPDRNEKDDFAEQSHSAKTQ